MAELCWYDATNLTIAGKGWLDTREPYHRLPARAEGVVRDVIWDLSTRTTGITVGFETDATEIHARWSLGGDTLSENHTSIYAFSGLDLYARSPSGRFQWVGVSRGMTDLEAESILTDWGALDGNRHEFRVYLPLYNSVTRLEIGVPEGSTMSASATRTEPPVAYYGTSIVHGAGVSRPGMSHVAMLGRRLNYPILNLGFSGNAIMEPEIADLLAELDPVLYVIDSLPNMGAEVVSERAPHFIRTLLDSRPETPLVLVEDRSYPAGWITPQVAENNRTRREAFRQVVAKIIAEDPSAADRIHYLNGEALLGTDYDGTSDGSHTNDLGASRMADALEPVLRRLIGLDRSGGEA